MSDPIRPIFIFSLPRSGSTLLQKILASHDAISTVAEPWVILPQVYALRARGIHAEYSHETLSHAYKAFTDSLSNGPDDYYEALNGFLKKLYRNLAGNDARFFLDKTPRYHLIIPEIVKIFPDSKFIVLWRNPLAIAASMIETWGQKNRWNLFRFKIDLYQGIENLARAANDLKNRMHVLRYEELVSNATESVSSIFNYLDLPFDKNVLQQFATHDFSRGLGDPTGPKKYDAISTDSISSWKKTFDNPLRRNWAKRYVNWIGAERLNLMGYDRDRLMGELASIHGINIQQLLSDCVLMPTGAAYTSFGLYENKRQLKALLSGGRPYPMN